LSVRRSYETSELELWPSLLPSWRAVELARMKGSYQANSVLLSDGDTGVRLAALLRADLEALLTDAKADELIGNAPGDRDALRGKWREKVNTRIALLDREGGPVVSVQWAGKDASPKLVREPLYAQVGEQLARCEIFTSATLRPVARLLKIRKLACFPEIFDWSKNVTARPVRDPDPRSRKNVPLDPALLEKLYLAEGRPLTLVLVYSRSHAYLLTQKLKGRPGVLIQGQDDRTLEELCAVALDPLESPVPAFFVTYGRWVGIDLPGPKWLVLGSVPKAPLSPYHEARAARRGGSPWNDPENAATERLQLKQGLGRALRSADDTATIIWTANRAAADLGLNPKTARAD
jgi:hypothetical protein